MLQWKKKGGQVERVVLNALLNQTPKAFGVIMSSGICSAIVFGEADPPDCIRQRGGAVLSTINFSKKQVRRPDGVLSGCPLSCSPVVP
jgi:hypothetical protein